MNQCLIFWCYTKLQNELASDEFCHSLSGDANCVWPFRPSEETSGDILSIWRNANLTLLLSFTREGYVDVCLE